MKLGEIRVIVKKPADITGKVQIIPNTLEKFQELVQGPIECVRIQNFILIMNEEGLLRKMKPNIWPLELMSPIVGPVVVAGVDGEEFTDCPLRMGEWMKIIKDWKVDYDR